MDWRRRAQSSTAPLWRDLARKFSDSRIGLGSRHFQDRHLAGVVLWRRCVDGAADESGMSLHFRKAVGKTLMSLIAGVYTLENKWRSRGLNHNGSSSSGTDREHPPTR